MFALVGVIVNNEKYKALEFSFEAFNWQWIKICCIMNECYLLDEWKMTFLGKKGELRNEIFKE